VVRPASEAVYVAAEEKERSRITSDNCTETTSLNSVIYSRCPRQVHCIRSEKKYKRRTITVRPQAQACCIASRPTSTKDASLCSPVCSTRRHQSHHFGRRVRAFGMRRSRYIGLAKTHLQHLGIAAAINLMRVVAWLDGDEPAPTNVSAFQRLCWAD